MADFLRRLRRIRRIERIPRVIPDRSNPLEVLSVSEVYERYRFRPHSVEQIVVLIYPRLNAPTRRSSPLPPLLSLLVTLQFFASGTHQLLIADMHQVSRSSVCRAIHRVTAALCELLKQFVVFPRGERARQIQREFYNIAGFPRVLGCVDGTHIKIQAPHDNEVDFINRKGFHSINVQMVCDAQFRVTNVVAKWPGSVHDSRMFRESDLCQQFEDGDIDGIVLGDSGYPCKPYLMTPYGNPQGPSQERFNTSLCRTRVLIEQTFGVLKRRFPCLSYGLRITPQWACKTTVACVVLHNFGLDNGDIFCRATEDVNVEPDVGIANDNTGARYRDFIVNTYFA